LTEKSLIHFIVFSNSSLASSPDYSVETYQ